MAIVLFLLSLNSAPPLAKAYALLSDKTYCISNDSSPTYFKADCYSVAPGLFFISSRLIFLNASSMSVAVKITLKSSIGWSGAVI